ncbi:MAG: NAD(P)-dependent oxidoreductase [Gammaproteobacteria bacterium]
MRHESLISRLAVLALLVIPATQAAADKFVIYGASGEIGGAIVEEALNRGHDVLGVSRDPARLTNEHANFSGARGDVTDVDSIVELVPGADAVIIAVSGVGEDNSPDSATTYRAAASYVEAAGRLGDTAPHVVQVGGGTTLFTNGAHGLDNPDLEPGTRRHGLYFGHWQALEAYRASEDVSWTVLSGNAGAMQPGERTGRYRLGGEETLYDAQGGTFVSTPDYAIAVIDVAENHEPIGRRAAVGPPLE